MHTDVFGAKLVGLDSVLLKTGEFKENDLLADYKPDYCLASISKLAELFKA